MSDEMKTVVETADDSQKTIVETASDTRETVVEQADTGAGTVLEQASAAAQGASAPRIAFPPELTDRVEYVRPMPARGAQAYLSVCRDVSSGREYVLKQYFDIDVKMDEAMLDKLSGRGLPEPEKDELMKHVVELVDYCFDRDNNWELQEYCKEGSLNEYRDSLPGKQLQGRAFQEVVSELTSAISCIHALDIIHRDLKPKNVLLRSKDPVDLVLADFGIAKEQEVSHAGASRFVGTPYYLAPEVFDEIWGKEADWWALGIILYEIYMGQHIFAKEDGSLPPQQVVIKKILDRAFSLDEITDVRVRDLLDGLLTKDMESRWGADQVAAWLRGENPAVIKDVKITVSQDPIVAANAFTIDGYEKIIVSPSDLIEVLRHHQKVTADLLLGGNDQLDLWVASQPFATAFRQILATKMSVDEKSMRLQYLLDPNGTLYFKGIALSEESIAEMCAKSGAGDEKASSWLLQVANGKALGVWGTLIATKSPVVAQRLVAGGRKILRWLEDAKTFVAKLGNDEWTEEYEKTHRAFIFLLFNAALSADEGIADGKGVSAGLKAEYKSLADQISGDMKSDSLRGDAATQVGKFNQSFSALSKAVLETTETMDGIPVFFAARVLI